MKYMFQLLPSEMFKELVSSYGICYMIFFFGRGIYGFISHVQESLYIKKLHTTWGQSKNADKCISSTYYSENDQ